MLTNVRICSRVNAGAYLANFTSPSEFALKFENVLPEIMTGTQAVAALRDSKMITDTTVFDAHVHGDNQTTVKAAHAYCVRRATSHPINEHFRVTSFASIVRLLNALQASKPDDTAEDTTRFSVESHDSERVLGEFMLQSHSSYTSLG